jgi:hypothetical protein
MICVNQAAMTFGSFTQGFRVSSTQTELSVSSSPELPCDLAEILERLAALTATGRIIKTGDGGYRLVG